MKRMKKIKYYYSSGIIFLNQFSDNALFSDDLLEKYISSYLFFLPCDFLFSKRLSSRISSEGDNVDFFT
jgi:nucleoside recognition membrane protein YjiH